MLEAAARRLAAAARRGTNPAAAVARARARGRAVAEAGGTTAESYRSGALALAADAIVSIALERDWERAEIETLVADLADLLQFAPEALGFELFSRAAGDPRLLEPLPRLVLETQLRLLTAFCAADDVSVWLGEAPGPPQLLAAVGGEPTRGIRAAARAAASGGSTPSGGAIHALPIARWDHVEGALVLRVRRRDARRALAFAGELLPRVALSLERTRLLSRTGEREAALVESAERRLARLGFDLHDGPLQEVFALGGELRQFKDQLRRVLGTDRTTPLVLGRVDDLEARLAALEAELRELARSLESPIVLKTPLPELLKQETDALAEGSRVLVSLLLDGNFESLTPSQTIALLRVVQEALGNIDAHAGARTATVTVSAGVDELHAEIVDDGQGFEVERTLVEAARGGRLGLVGMSERVRLLGGRLDLESKPGGPTRVFAVIPRWRPGDAEL